MIPKFARRIAVAFAAAIIVFALVSWAAPRGNYSGTPTPIGGGSIHSFVTLADDGSPAAIGVSFTRNALERLPVKMNTHSRCHDLDSNGTHARHECIGDYETILEIPEALAQKAEIPFRWVMVNWNAEGHQAPAPPVYGVPHFDFHFYAWDRDKVNAIAAGSCGELADCNDFKRGSVPIPAEYLPPGHIDVGAVVPRMGNHLVDSRSPELQKTPAPFTTTFIYGAFDGELIFWEPMITLEFLSRASAECREIRLPQKVLRPGHYPKEYCVRYDARTGERTVSLESFVHMGN